MTTTWLNGKMTAPLNVRHKQINVPGGLTYSTLKSIMREQDQNTFYKGIKMVAHGFISLKVGSNQSPEKVIAYISKYAILVSKKVDYQRNFTSYIFQATYPLCVMIRRNVKERFPTFTFEVCSMEPVKIERKYSPIEQRIIINYVNGASVDGLAQQYNLTANVVNSIIEDVRWRSGKKILQTAKV